MVRTEAIILAAGEARRFGAPKQLLLLDGETLVQRAIGKAWAAGCCQVNVVVGANRDQVAAGIRHEDCDIVAHLQWREGIGSSIACGVRAARRRAPQFVLLMLCDQPLVPVAHFQELIRVAVGNVAIAATEYNGSIGVPTCFPAVDFDALAGLSGDRGAKALLRQEGVREIACEAAAWDIDSPEDWLQIQEEFRRTR